MANLPIIPAATRRLVDRKVQRCGFETGRFIRAANAFFKRPWWSRVWVVQELNLAKRDPTFYCGRVSTATANISDNWSKLSLYLIDHGTLNSAISRETDIDIQHEFIKVFERQWNITQLYLGHREKSWDRTSDDQKHAEA